MKILIVDDQLVNIQLIEMILGDYGYECCSAADGKEACQMFQQDENIQLVLMDVNMPVMDGLSAARAMKSLCVDRHVPIIFVTALDNVEVLTCCLDAGGDDFVPKPVNESILISKIRAHQRTFDTYQKLVEANKKLLYHRNLMNRELNIVEHVFNNGLSRQQNKFDHVSFYSSPMSMFNGDLLLLEKSSQGSTYIILGDFTGHGLAAAIGCLPVSTVFQSMAEQHYCVGDIAREINKHLLQLLPASMFFCAVIMELNQTGERLNVWMGGMHELFVFSGDGQYVEEIISQHMPLGVLADEDFDETEQAYLPPDNSYIFAYTDGAVEAKNNKGEMFGTERLQSAIKTSFKSSLPGVDYVVKALEEFQSKDSQDDDISMLALHCQYLNLGQDAVSVKGKIIPEQESGSESIFPWSINLELGPKLLANKYVVRNVVNVITSIEGCSPHRQSIFLVVSELLNNAIEHGVLELPRHLKNTHEGFGTYFKLRQEKLANLTDGVVKVQCRLLQNPARLEVIVSDSGPGFDYMGSPIDDISETACNGRGLALVAESCSSLVFSDGGCSATAVISL